MSRNRLGDVGAVAGRRQLVVPVVRRSVPEESREAESQPGTHTVTCTSSNQPARCRFAGRDRGIGHRARGLSHRRATPPRKFPGRIVRYCGHLRSDPRSSPQVPPCELSPNLPWPDPNTGSHLVIDRRRGSFGLLKHHSWASWLEAGCATRFCRPLRHRVRGLHRLTPTARRAASPPQELQTRIGEATRPLEPFCVQLRPTKDTADTVLKSGRGLPVKSALCLLSA